MRNTKGQFTKGHKKLGGYSIPKGKIAWNKGLKGIIKWSQEAKDKLSKIMIEKGHMPPHPKGENHPSWRGGITSEQERIRNSTEMKLWHKACLERDHFTCQKTGQIGGKLIVHHINNFADFPELRTSIENGITFSVEAHLEFHKIYGKRNNTREQLLEFLALK